MSVPGGDRGRFLRQMLQATSSSMDLRQYKSDDQFKKLVWDFRDVRDRAFDYMFSNPVGRRIYDQNQPKEHRMMWDEHLIKVANGTEQPHPCHWYPSEIDPNEPIWQVISRYVDYHRDTRGH